MTMQLSISMKVKKKWGKEGEIGTGTVHKIMITNIRGAMSKI